jgi:hypothetical protein
MQNAEGIKNILSYWTHLNLKYGLLHCISLVIWSSYKPINEHAVPSSWGLDKNEQEVDVLYRDW